jgi:MarR family transcriptional regulator, lower aerobic nicotinate degradation pathway regulator
VPLTLARVPDLPVVGQPVHRSAALLDYMARHMRVASEAVLGPLGLRPRHLIALTVLRDHGASGQQHLAGLLQIDRTNVVGLLNELEDAQLIERRRSVEDRRRHMVQLTDAGHAKLAEAELALAAVEDRVLSALDDEQRERLYELLLQATSGIGCEPSAGARGSDSCSTGN